MGLRTGLMAVMLMAASVGPLAGSVASAQEADDVSMRVRGTWNLTLSPSEAERVRALELAFADPVPSDEALGEASLDEEAMMVATLVTAIRRTNPEDPELDQYRAGLEGLKNATLVVDGVSLTLDFGTMVSRLGYRVLDERRDRMRIETSDEVGDHSIAVLRLRDDGSVMQFIEEGRNGQRLAFTRAP